MLTLECIICGSSTTPAEPAQATVHAGGGHELGARLGAEADSRGVQGQVRYRRGEGACFDTARLTRHAGVPGRRRRVGGAAADSPSYVSSLGRPGRLSHARETGPKRLTTRRGGTRPTGVQYFSARGGKCARHSCTHAAISLAIVRGRGRARGGMAHFAPPCAISRFGPPRNISSVCALVCMCELCVDMTRDAMIDTGGERNRV